MAEWNWRRRLLAATGYLELDMLGDAARELDAVPIEHRESPDVIGIRLSLAMAVKDWPLAAELAQHMVTVQPDEPSWWINLAYSVRRCQSIELAEEILLQAAIQHPKEVMIHFNLACYASVTGRLAIASERLQQAIALNPKIRALALEDEDLLPLRESISNL
jgi:Flp pilus assembly protein TadD